jgi:hypothetical protein
MLRKNYKSLNENRFWILNMAKLMAKVYVRAELFSEMYKQLSSLKILGLNPTRGRFFEKFFTEFLKKRII